MNLVRLEYQWCSTGCAACAWCGSDVLFAFWAVSSLDKLLTMAAVLRGVIVVPSFVTHLEDP